MDEICANLSKLVLSKSATPRIFEYFSSLRGDWRIDTSFVDLNNFSIPKAEDVDGFYFIQETTNRYDETDSVSIGKLGEHYFLLYGFCKKSRSNHTDGSGTFTLSDSLPRLIDKLTYSKLIDFRTLLIPDGKSFDSEDIPL